MVLVQTDSTAEHGSTTPVHLGLGKLLTTFYRDRLLFESVFASYMGNLAQASATYSASGSSHVHLFGSSHVHLFPSLAAHAARSYISRSSRVPSGTPSRSTPRLSRAPTCGLPCRRTSSCATGGSRPARRRRALPGGQSDGASAASLLRHLRAKSRRSRRKSTARSRRASRAASAAGTPRPPSKIPCHRWRPRRFLRPLLPTPPPDRRRIAGGGDSTAPRDFPGRDRLCLAVTPPALWAATTADKTRQPPRQHATTTQRKRAPVTAHHVASAQAAKGGMSLVQDGRARTAGPLTPVGKARGTPSGKVVGLPETHRRDFPGRRHDKTCPRA